MSGYEQSSTVGLELEGARAAAAEHDRGAASLWDVAELLGSVFDGSAVHGRYAHLGAALVSGIDGARASIGRWSASSAAVGDAVRSGVQASADVDQSCAGGLGELQS